MKNSLPQDLVVVEVNGENRIDSRIIAKRMGINPKNFFELIKDHQHEFEKVFGTIHIRTEVDRKQGGGRPEKYALLTEEQVTACVSLSRYSARYWGKDCDSKKSQLRESTMQQLYAKYLVEQGENVRREVNCEAGTADIVTDNAIYEFKKTLTAKSIFEAIGQVLVYRSCINPNAKAVIIGGHTEDLDRLRPSVENMGVEVILWEDCV